MKVDLTKAKYDRLLRVEKLAGELTEIIQGDNLLNCDPGLYSKARELLAEIGKGAA